MPSSYEAKNALSLIVQLFKTGDLPEKLSKAYIKDPDPNKPMRKYSLFNKMLIYAQGTTDARGCNQWKKVEREVNYSKHPYKVNILTPRFSYACKKCNDTKLGFSRSMTWKGKIGYNSKYVCSNCGLEFITGSKDKSKVKSILIGFNHIGLYKVQDTEGKPLPEFKPEELPPLTEVGNRWGIELKYEPTLDGSYGYTNGKKIVLSCDDDSIYFHELMHEADRKNNKLKGGQDSIQEIVAELGSCCLMKIFGSDPENKYASWSYDYIKGYTMNKNGQPKENEEIARICMKVIGRIEKAFDEIFKTIEEIKKTPMLEVKCR